MRCVAYNIIIYCIANDVISYGVGINDVINVCVNSDKNGDPTAPRQRSPDKVKTVTQSSTLARAR